MLPMQDGQEVLDSLDTQIDPAHAALVLVDVQNDCVHPDGLMARRKLANFEDTTSLVPQALPRLARLLEAARAVNLAVVFVQMVGDQKYVAPPMLALQRRRRRGDGASALLEGTWGGEFYGDLRPNGRAREFVVRKHRYSAFWGTNLDLILRSNGIKTLVMTGVATSGCVESTTRDAFFNSYYVVTAADCCADYDVARHENSLRKMDISFGYVVPSETILKAWGRATERQMAAAGLAASA
jgi:ureidoacrylate peracid hydrolase